MAHFGLLCPPTPGHLNPITAIGYELLKRQHQVTLINVLDAHSKAITMGLNFCPLGEDEYPLGSISSIQHQLGRLNGWKALNYSLKLGIEATSLLLRSLPQTIQSLGIDALIIDQHLPGAPTVADYLGIPFIGLWSAIPINQESEIPPALTAWHYNPNPWTRLRNRTTYGLLNICARPIRKVINEYRQVCRLPLYRHPHDAFSKLAQISQLPKAFDFPRKTLPPYFHFVGPLINFNRDSVSLDNLLTDQPLIYATPGTVTNRIPKIFHKIASACLGLDIQLVMDLGNGMSPNDLGTLPGNPIVLKAAPQLQILKQASLAFTHAGLNTTLEALYFGVPQIAIPLAFDQLGIAARITRTKTGKAIHPREISIKKIRQSIEDILTNDTYQKNVQKLQTVIYQSNGPVTAANIIEKTLQVSSDSLNSLNLVNR